MSPGPLAPVEVTAPTAPTGEAHGFQSRIQCSKLLTFRLDSSQLPSNKITQLGPTSNSPSYSLKLLPLSL